MAVSTWRGLSPRNRFGASEGGKVLPHIGKALNIALNAGLYADGGRHSAPSPIQITEGYHLLSNLAEAVERDIQQLQGKARAALAGQANPKKNKKLIWIEARRRRCRQARYERYLAVVELGQQGYTQLAIAERWEWERKR